ncbi:MBL fold metallo-hydrolase [Actinomadura welshii]
MDNNAYLVTCSATGETLLIDAANDAEVLIDLVQRYVPKLSLIVTSHRHFDHWSSHELLSATNNRCRYPRGAVMGEGSTQMIQSTQTWRVLAGGLAATAIGVTVFAGGTAAADPSPPAPPPAIPGVIPPASLPPVQSVTAVPVRRDGLISTVKRDVRPHSAMCIAASQQHWLTSLAMTS